MGRRIPSWLPPALIALAGFLLHFARLTESPFLSGWDGYFYVVQLKALHEEGAMHSPDASPIYLLLRAVFALVQDYELSYQIVSAGLAGLFSALVFRITEHFSASRRWALVAALWSLASPSLAYFTANFPKNLLGMDLLLLFWWGSLRRAPWRWLGLIGAGISHRLTAGLGLIFLVSRRLHWRWVLIGVGSVGAMVLLGSVVPGWLGMADFERFEGVLTWPPEILSENFAERMETDGVWRVEGIVQTILVGLWVVLAVFKRGFWQENPEFKRGFLVVFVFLNLPVWGMETMGMGYRFYLAGMILLPVALVGVGQWLGDRARYPLAAAGLFGVIWTATQFSTAPFQPDYPQFAVVSDRLDAELADQDPELVIGHKTLAEFITFRTGIDVLPWQPEYHVPERKLWRLSHGILRSDFRSLLTPAEMKHVRHLTPTYALLPEFHWQLLIKKATLRGDDELLERLHDDLNPHEERPAYLRR